MADRIQCVDCGETFEFSDGEAEFYAQKGYTPPKRCKPCRRVKKQKFGDWEDERRRD